MKVENKDNQAGKQIVILLTKYSDLFSKLICGISKNKYSHASICIDEQEEIFYSFNKRGFVIEKPKKRFPKTRVAGSAIIRMRVPESTYDLIKKEVECFVEKRKTYSYSKFGVFLCILGIPHKFEDKYFCSQFVAELLQKTGAARLYKKECLFFPGQFIDKMECLFGEKQIVYNVI